MHAGYEEIMRTPIVRSFDDAERNIKIGESSKRDENGRIPLWIAANLGNFGHLMLYLKGAGVDPNTIDNEGAWQSASQCLCVRVQLAYFF